MHLTQEWKKGRQEREHMTDMMGWGNMDKHGTRKGTWEQKRETRHKNTQRNSRQTNLKTANETKT